jgi:hypothetical protein
MRVSNRRTFLKKRPAQESLPYNLINGARVSAAAAEDNVSEDRLYVSPAFKAKYCSVSHKLTTSSSCGLLMFKV